MTAYQTPWDLATATKVGPRKWWKQILPKGTVKYKGVDLTFDDKYLTDLAGAFNAQAYDQVPFQLAPDDNAHTANPERFRGEISAMKVADDGLYGLFETTEAGSKVVEDNPKLGVSCRIVPDRERPDGSKGPAIEHVLGTLNPVATGMKPWEAVSLSTPSEEVVDLTAATISPKGANMPDLTDERRAELDQYFNEMAALTTTPATPAAGTPAATPPPAGTPAPGAVGSPGVTATGTTPTDAELQAALDAIETDDTTGTPTTPAAGTANLSAEQQSAIELSRAQSQQAAIDLAVMRDELDAQRFENEKSGLLAAGVPAVIVDLATPLLLGTGHTIDLSNNRTVDAGEVVRSILKELHGTIDMSREHPAGPSQGGPASKSDAILAQWERDNPTGRVTQS